MNFGAKPVTSTQYLVPIVFVIYSSISSLSLRNQCSLSDLKYCLVKPSYGNQRIKNLLSIYSTIDSLNEYVDFSSLRCVKK